MDRKLIPITGLWLVLGLALAQAQPASFTPQPTPQSAGFAGQAQLDGVFVDTTDWVAAFDSLGNCVGADRIIVDQGISYINLTVYGDDGGTANVDEGLNAQEPFFLRLWDATTNTIYPYPAPYDTTGFTGWENQRGSFMPQYSDFNQLYNFASTPPFPAPTVAFDFSASLCQGDSAITLSGGMPMGGDYRGPGVDNGTFTPGAAGAGNVDLFYVYTDSLGCYTDSAAASVQVDPTPATPSISTSGDTLLASGSGSFQWYQDGQPITDATDGFFVPTADSAGYQVQVISDSGCTSALSEVFLYELTQLVPALSQSWRVGPNPFAHELKVSWALAKPARVELTLYNQMGQRVATLTQQNWAAGSQQLRWNASDLPEGLYLLRPRVDGLPQAPIQLLHQR